MPERGFVGIIPRVGIKMSLADELLAACEDESLAPELRRHITCRVVERLEPIVQAHTIEGLRMGVKV